MMWDCRCAERSPSECHTLGCNYQRKGPFMIHRSTFGLFGIACLAWFAGSPAAAGEDLLSDSEGRPSLQRWQSFHETPIAALDEVWQLRDGVLMCQGQPRGYLYTKAAYSDFVLQLEWRWPPGGKPGNGGVLVRMTGEHKIWPRSLEAQLNAGSEGDFVGLVGYPLTGPQERLRTLEHPQFGRLTILSKSQMAAQPAGEWNTLEVTARADSVTIQINGQLVNRATGCEVVSGPILLTAENDAIQFATSAWKPRDERK
jgi:hypothetical protein